MGPTRTLGAIALGMALAACAAGPARQDSFYRLEPAAPAALPAPALDGVLEVERFRVDALTGERALLFRSESVGGELRRQAYAFWVDSPAIMVQLAFARGLRGAGVAREVVTPEQRRRSDYVLTGRIHRLERLLADSKVALELELSVTRERDREAVLHGVYREERAAGRSTGAAVEALNGALAGILARVVRDLAESGA